MRLTLSVFEDKSRSKDTPEIVGVISSSRQPRASVWAICRETSEHNDTARHDGCSRHFDIAISFGCVDEKMEGGSIVPYVIGALRLPGAHVDSHEVHGL